jgi:hypothetical protein
MYGHHILISFQRVQYGGGGKGVTLQWRNMTTPPWIKVNIYSHINSYVLDIM